MLKALLKIFYSTAVFLTIDLVTMAKAIAESVPPKILIVEDDKGFREASETSFRQHHYNVRSAQDVNQGLSQWRSFQPDIVITDMSMPLDINRLPQQDGGLILLKQAPMDKAKVILASFFSKSEPFMREALLLAEYNFDGKIVSEEDVLRLNKIIQSFLTSEEPPNRIKHLQNRIKHPQNRIKHPQKKTWWRSCLQLFTSKG